MPLLTKRIDFLGVTVDAVDMAQAISLATEAMQSDTRLQHGDLNVSKFVQMRENSDLLQ
jgi:UDP-N-acetyl-D-mannosaminuronic acid transferase (WecB/TagA/CpsF family)